MKKQWLNKIVITICALAFVFPFANIFSNKLNSVSAYTYDDLTANARQTFDFNSGWTFSKGQGVQNSGSTKEQAYAVSIIPNNSTTAVYSTSYEQGFTEENPGENGEVWENVSLPHTYNDTDSFDDYVEALDNNRKLSHNGERTIYGGTAWYKKSFYIPKSYEGKKIFIEFEAARQSAQIWVNGVAIKGTYLNGFIAFGYDLTSALNYEEEGDANGAWNEITVLVDNSYPYYVSVVTNDNGTPADATDDYDEFVSMYTDGSGTYTLSDNPIVWHDPHWHPNFGGLYRNSYLYVVNDLHLTLPLYSFMETQGTYVYTSNEEVTKDVEGNILASTATINVDAEIQNSALPQDFKFVARIKDMSGTVVGEITSFYKSSDVNKTLNATQSFSANEKVRLIGSTPISSVQRWSTDFPYLYTVECMIIKTENGEDIVVDNNSTEIGVRTFRATTDKGFLLNENFIYLHGWGQKSTNEWAGIGAAYQDWMQEYVISLMKQGGGNYIRFGHTAGSPAQIKSADKLGLIVTQPGVDGEGPYSGDVTAATKLIYTSVTKQVRMDAFRDMIIYFRNHASIMFWEIGNNTMDTSMAATMRGYINTYDYAGRNSTTGAVANSGKYSSTTDESSRFSTVRRYTSETNPYVDTTETTEGTGGNALKPKVEGEYNRFEARRGVWDLNTLGFEDFENIYTSGNADYQYLTSETYALEQVKTYYSKLLMQGLTHMGGANWIFSDSTSHGRLLSEVARCSGEVDATMLEKEAYYVTQVLFNDNEITSHIIGHWNYPSKNTLTKYVISKAHHVKLVVEYQERGQTKTDEYLCPNLASNPPGTNSQNSQYIFTFNDVVYKSGRIYCVGYDKDNNVIATAGDSVSTHGTPAGIRITQRVTSPNGLLANGSDYLILDVEVVDSLGNRCLTFDGEYENKSVSFSVNGEGTTCTWIGGYNSSIENTIRAKSLYFEAGLLRIALRTTQQAGPMSITATMGVLSTTSSIYNSTAVAQVINTAGAGCNYSLLTTRIAQNDLSEITPIEYGTVKSAPILPGEDVINAESSLYVSDMECYGPSSYYEVKSLVEGNLLYQDYSYTWQTIPKKYTNGEYVLLNNSNSSSQLETLVSISIRLNCTMMLLFPVKATVPAWVANSGFVFDPNKNFVSSIGVIYAVYYKDVLADHTYSLGSPDAINNQEVMYIIGCCIPVEPTASPVILNEPFDEGWTCERAAQLYGATSIEVQNASLTHVQDFADSNNVTKNAIVINDTALQAGGAVPYTAYIAYPITNQRTGKFEVSFDYWINSTSKTQWARIFFQQGDEYSNVGTAAAFRLFMENNTSQAYVNMYYRIGRDSENSAGSNFTSGTYLSGVWHSYKVLVDMDSKEFTVSIFDGATYVELATGISFNSTANNACINYIMFAGGNNGSQHVAIANLEVKVINENLDIIRSLTINGSAIPEFNQLTTFYYMGEANATTNPLPNASDFVITFGDDKQDYDANNSYLLEYDDYLGRYVLTIKDIDDNFHVYTFSYAYYSQYVLGEAVTYYDRLIYTVSEDRPRTLINMYEGRAPYADLNETFSSIPYEYSGAEMSKVDSFDKITRIKLKLRYNTTMLLLIRVFESGTTPAGWTNTGKIVSLSNGWIYRVFTKEVVANSIFEMDYTTFSSLTTTPIMGMKITSQVENGIFLYDDFNNVDRSDPQNVMPYDWTKYVVTGNTNIQYEEEESGDNSLLFTDTVSAYDSFAFLQKSFSTQTNKFVFTIQMYFDADFSSKFVRFWLKNGILDPANYADDNEKKTVALEMYFEEESTAGYVKLTSRQVVGDNKNINSLITNIPKGEWITFNITIDCQLHNYVVECSYPDAVNGINGIMTKVSLSRSFLRLVADGAFCINTIDTLIIGTGGNATNKFKVRSVKIVQLSDGNVLNITSTINGVTAPVTSFNELTSEYMIYLDANNTLPTSVNVTSISGSTATVVLNQLTCAYDIAVNYGNYEYDYKVHLYARFEPLQNYLGTLLPQVASKYTAASWLTYFNALTYANNLVDTKSHNYFELTNAQTALQTSYNALALNHAVVMVDSGLGDGKQISKAILVEFVEETPNVYYDGKITATFNRTVNDGSVFAIGHILTFANNMPVGTIITVADYQSAVVKFYYCIVTQAKREFSLINDFIEMGFGGLQYIENLENYSGEIRVYIDMANATKQLGAQSLTLTINDDATATVSYNVIDYPIVANNLQITFTSLNELEYSFIATQPPAAGYYAFSMDNGTYVISDETIYPVNNNSILLPSSVTSGKLVVREQKNSATNYNELISSYPSANITLPMGITGTSIKVAIVNNEDNYIHKNNILDMGKEINFTVTILGATDPVLNYAVEKYVVNTGFSGDYGEYITFDAANNKITVLNTVDKGMYRVKIFFTQNAQEYCDYIYIFID